MKVKPVDPNAVIRDPVTMLPLPAEGGDVADDSIHWNRRWLHCEVWKLEGKEWVKRLPSGELERAPYVAPSQPAQPTGREPVTPLTTREGQ